MRLLFSSLIEPGNEGLSDIFRTIERAFSFPSLLLGQSIKDRLKQEHGVMAVKI